MSAVPLKCFHVVGVTLAVTVAISGRFAAQTALDLQTATIQDIQSAVDSGTLTYETLVHQYLARIEAFDRNGPRLRAVLNVNPRAASIARELDEERRTRGRRGPLHGIPIAVKDNIDTADMPTTGGSLIFAGSVPRRDATVIERLRRAGAIVFIKTNLDEFAASSMGLSSLGGQTLNPYDLERSPGGSSGGTAVAVAAGFATAGLATETGVSIRGPASNTAIVAIAPSLGLVSRAGVMPISFTQDRVGVHAKTVIDASVLLDAIRGFDAEDLLTAESLDKTPAGGAVAPTSTLQGVRIGKLSDLNRTGPEFDVAHARVAKQIGLLAGRGAAIVENVRTGLDLIGMMPNLRLNNFELRPSFDVYLARRGDQQVKTLADLIATGKWLKGGNLELRLQETMKIGDFALDEEYHRRRDVRARLRHALIDVMDRGRLDALVYPTKLLGAPPLGTADTGNRDNAISSVSGLPAIVVPCALDRDGLPIGLEFLGRPFSEATLIRLALEYERLHGPRPLPQTTRMK
jgi:Asp-tRNA(Asn)/Glu-tRNA(Gln) amidotransferase A subunit family amidase